MTSPRQNNTRELNGITLSMLLGQATPSVEEIHRILDDEGQNCNFEYRDVHGNTCLQRALDNLNIPNVIYRKILELGGKPDVSNDAGMPAIVRAAMRGDVYCVEKMKEKGAIINALTKQSGTTPLIELIRAGCNKFDIEKMIKLGANVNTADDAGWTPLIFAIRVNMNPHNVAENIQTLYANGACPLARAPKQGLGVQEFAAQTYNPIIIAAVEDILAQETAKQEERRRKMVHDIAKNAASITEAIDAPSGVTIGKKIAILRL